MAEELQHLLDAIQRDGVEKAESEAKTIIGEARTRAREILDEASAQAEEIRKRGRRDAQRDRESGEEALRQAARDAVLAAGAAIDRLLLDCIQGAVDGAMTPETIRRILIDMAREYFRADIEEGPAHVYLSEDDERALASFATHELLGSIRRGAELHPHPDIGKGFRVGFRDGALYHDFTSRAVAEEMHRTLKPRLREILRDAIEQELGG